MVEVDPIDDDPDDDDTVQAVVASPGNTSGGAPAQAMPAAIGQIGTFGLIPASDITWDSVVLVGTKSNGDTEAISNNSTGIDFGKYVSLTLSLKWRATNPGSVNSFSQIGFVSLTKRD